MYWYMLCQRLRALASRVCCLIWFFKVTFLQRISNNFEGWSMDIRKSEVFNFQFVAQIPKHTAPGSPAVYHHPPLVANENLYGHLNPK